MCSSGGAGVLAVFPSLQQLIERHVVVCLLWSSLSGFRVAPKVSKSDFVCFSSDELNTDGFNRLFGRVLKKDLLVWHVPLNCGPTLFLDGGVFHVLASRNNLLSHKE